MIKVKLVEVGEIGTILLPLPSSFIYELGWSEGDELSFELVVNRVGQATHIVLEKVGQNG